MSFTRRRWGAVFSVGRTQRKRARELMRDTLLNTARDTMRDILRDTLGRAALLLSTIAALTATGCSTDADRVHGQSASDSGSSTTAAALYTGNRFTQDEAAALATLASSAAGATYRAASGAATFVVSGVVEASGSFVGDSLVEPTHDQRACRAFRDVITPQQRDAVGNAIVWLAGITSGKPNDLPKRTSVRLNECRLEPRVHVIAEGGTVLVGSRDVMESRLRMSDILSPGVAPRAIVPLNDFGQVVPNAAIAREGGLVEVSDDRHPWVRGYIAVASHPYVAVTNATGTFQFSGVPAGRHEVIVFSESLGIMRRMIEVNSDTHIALKYTR